MIAPRLGPDARNGAKAIWRDGYRAAMTRVETCTGAAGGRRALRRHEAGIRRIGVAVGVVDGVRGVVGARGARQLTEACMGQVVELAAVRSSRRGQEKPRTKAEIAEHFGVSVRTISRWMSSRGMPFDKPFEGGSVRFSLRDCEAWFRGRER